MVKVDADAPWRVPTRWDIWDVWDIWDIWGEGQGVFFMVVTLLADNALNPGSVLSSGRKGMSG